jgi:DNA-directed RNA polymerase specialized sigma24 family protein
VTPSEESDWDRSADIDGMRAAFRTLHGQRLHGFTILLLLGDEARARELASSSLAAGMANVLALRHPERAAAWLRADVLRLARTRGSRKPVEWPGLEQTGVSGFVADALGALDVTQRAALISADIERMDLRDVDTVVGRSAAAGARLLADARRRYVAAYKGHADAAGPLAQRIAAIAASVGRFGAASR